MLPYSYPVKLVAKLPTRFDRVQLLTRIILLCALSVAGITMGAAMLVIYLALPAFVAARIYGRGGARFLAEDGPRITRALEWFTALFAYLFLLSDCLPVDQRSTNTRVYVQPQGTPTPGMALLRLVSSLPSAFVFALLGVVSWMFWIVAALSILLTERVPRFITDFQCGMLRWQARLLAYHASLIEYYPPFVLDIGPSPEPALVPQTAS